MQAPASATELAAAQDTLGDGELLFLVLHALRASPFRDAADALVQEAVSRGLLPRRTDPLGARLPSGRLPTVAQSYSQISASHPHVRSDHLLKLLSELVRVDASRRGPGAGAGSLLGDGAASLLPAAQAAVRLPPWTRWPHRDVNIAHSQLLRELGGSPAGGQARLCTSACAHPERGCPPRLLCGGLRRHRVLRGHKAAVYCGIPDAAGSRILTGSDDYLVKVWNAHTGALMHTCRGHEQQIMYLAVSCDNTVFASASIDSVIRTWRLADGAPLAVLMGHTSAVTELSFCPAPGEAPHLLLSCGAEGHVLLWDATSDTVPPLALGSADTLDGGHQQDEAGPSSQQPGAPVAQAPQGDIMLFCSFSPDARLCAASSPDFSVRLWRVSTSACASGGLPRPGDVVPLGSLRGHRNEIHVIQFNASSDALVTGSLDGTVRVWRAAPQGAAHAHDAASAWACAHVLTPPAPPPPPGSRARARASPPVHLVRWAGEPGAVCVIASLQDTTVCVWDAATGQLHARVRRHTLEVFVVEVHPVDPRLVLTAGYDGRVCVWDLRRLCAGAPPVTAAAQQPTGGGSAPLLLEDASAADDRGIPDAEFDLRGSLPEHAMKLLDARWHPDGTGFVVSDESGAIHLFGTGQGAQLAGARTEQFFARDYEPLVRDQRNWVADVQTQQPPHLTQRAELLVAGDEQPYPEAYQTAFRLGTVLGSGIAVEPLDDETLRNVRVDVLAERRRLTERARWHAAGGNAGTGAGPTRGGQRGAGPGAASRGARAGGNAAEAGPPGAGVAAAAPPPAVIFISDDSLDSASSSSDHDDDFDDHLGGATGGSSDDGTGASSDDTGRSGGGGDDSLGGAGPSNGNALRRSSRRVGTRASARTRGGDGEERRERRPATRHTGRAHGDELEAAQPVYATRHASARRAAATGGGDSDGGGGSEPESSEEPARKRARRDEGGHRRGAASDDLEDSDSQDSARQRRRERERRRRAAKRAAREAKRARRMAGGAGQEVGDGAGPSHQNGGGGASRPRSHPPGASTFRDGTAFAWLQRTERARGEYVPQLGDQVVYIAQGHAGYLDACGDARAVRPWTIIPGFRGVEPCVVTGLEYQIMKDKGNITVARLTLTMADDAHGQRATRFEVELPDMTLESCPDFIVEYSRYLSSSEHPWEAQARAMVWWPEAEEAPGKWWMGTVWDTLPEDPAWRGSPWGRIHVVYDLNAEPEEHHSCWELFEPVPNSDPGAVAQGQRWMPRPDRNVAHLDGALTDALLAVLLHLISEPGNGELVEAPTAEEVVTQHARPGGTFFYCAKVPLPIGLRTIQQRLQSGYYRQPDAVRSDAVTLRSNVLAVHTDAAPISAAAIRCCDQLLAALPQPQRLPVMALPGPPLPALVHVPRLVVTRRRAAAEAGPSRGADGGAASDAVAGPSSGGGGRHGGTRSQTARQQAPPTSPGAGGRLSVRLRTRTGNNPP